jgi:hypothetical protein
MIFFLNYNKQDLNCPLFDTTNEEYCLVTMNIHFIQNRTEKLGVSQNYFVRKNYNDVTIFTKNVNNKANEKNVDDFFGNR